MRSQIAVDNTTTYGPRKHFALLTLSSRCHRWSPFSQSPSILVTFAIFRKAIILRFVP